MKIDVYQYILNKKESPYSQIHQKPDPLSPAVAEIFICAW